MSFKEWTKLPEAVQKEQCQSLNPNEQWPLFKQVEEAFVSCYGDQPGIAHIFCGFGGGLGPINAITVSINKGKRVKIPKQFLGFPVFRKYILA